jgi:hypothetical protein
MKVLVAQHFLRSFVGVLTAFPKKAINVSKRILWQKMFTALMEAIQLTDARRQFRFLSVPLVLIRRQSLSSIDARKRLLAVHLFLVQKVII